MRSRRRGTPSDVAACSPTRRESRIGIGFVSLEQCHLVSAEAELIAEPMVETERGHNDRTISASDHPDSPVTNNLLDIDIANEDTVDQTILWVARGAVDG